MLLWFDVQNFQIAASHWARTARAALCNVPSKSAKLLKIWRWCPESHWNIFEHHNLPSFPEEAPNYYWDPNHEGGNQHDCNSANQILYSSFCHHLCCIDLLTIYPSKSRIQISHVYTAQICASFSTGSGSGGRRSRINSLTNRTDCKPPPKDWSFDKSGPLVDQGGGREQKKT